MTSRRRVCVVTGSRAEYGLLYWLLRDMASEPGLELQLVATGAHLAPEFGSTARLIEDDGFQIDARVEMLLSSDSPVGIAKSVGVGVIGFADTFRDLAPDVVVLLGDRFEILAAASAAMLMRVPIAHIHGGESSEGAVDESIRHAVTKMAHLHFTAAEAYRQRVIQLGESPDRVFNTGALGVDNLVRLELMERAALEASLGMRFGDGPLILCTYHPVTLSGDDPSGPLGELFAALDAIPDATVVFTKANADAGGRRINELVDEYAAARDPRVGAFVTLGQRRYLSMLREADVVVGNSSSGLLEAPSAQTPTVNIGARQQGRLKAPSVIDCGESRGAIREAIERALTPDFQRIAAAGETFFGDGRASGRIVAVLRDTPLEGILVKAFHQVLSATAAVAGGGE